MAINEKKPLFVRIAGERQPNLLPVTASAVGFDFNRDRFVFYHTASDDWADISPDGVDFVGSVYADNFFASGVVTASLGLSGSLTTLADGTSYLIAGAGINITSASNGPVTISSLAMMQPEYWFSTGSNEVYTTGSVLLRAGLSATPTPNLIEFDISGSEYTQYAPYRSAPFTSAGTFIAVKNVDVADPGWISASGSINILAATVFASGSGGEVLISAGAGGYSSGSNAGFGGSILATAGEGGSAADTASLSGEGGSVALQGGYGGAGYTIGGSGGSVSIQGGFGGDKVPENTSDPFHGAPGGFVEIVGGSGANGINSDGANSINRVGGTVKIVGGVGGYSGGVGVGEEAAAGEVWIEGAPISAVSASISGSLLSVGGNFPFRAISINNNPTNTLSSSPDTFFFVSGGVGQKGGSAHAIATFGGDLHVSGALSVSQNIFAESGAQVAGGLGVTGSAEFLGGLSGSLTTLADGTSYLIAGNGIEITSASNGPVTVSKNLRDLITFIDQGPACGFPSGYKEQGPAGPFPTQSVWYTDASKTNKIVELIVTWSGPVPSTSTWQAYEADGVTVNCTVVDTFTYVNSIFEETRTRVIT